MDNNNNYVDLFEVRCTEGDSFFDTDRKVMHMEIKRLKNSIGKCPYCGGDAYVRYRAERVEKDVVVSRERFYVECDSENCGARTGKFGSKEEAVRAWNALVSLGCPVWFCEGSASVPGVPFSEYISAVPPGAVIKKQLIKKDISVSELSDKLSLPVLDTLRLLCGTLRITPNMALTLQDFLGFSSSFWLGLERFYRERAEGDQDVDDSTYVIYIP